MHKNKRVTILLGALALAATLTGCGAAPSDEKQVVKEAAKPAPAEHRMLLSQGLAKLEIADETRADEYERDLFHHWVDADGDGCNARYEVLIEEAMTKPKVGPGCKLTGGTWHSYPDDVTVDSAQDMTIDHMVPLAEAWRSGASEWSASSREEYANDLDSPYTLVGITRSANSSKSDQDPAEWLPGNEVCRYLSEWVSTKLRWKLSADPQEVKAIEVADKDCSKTPLAWRDADPRPAVRIFGPRML